MLTGVKEMQHCFFSSPRKRAKGKKFGEKMLKRSQKQSEEVGGVGTRRSTVIRWRGVLAGWIVQQCT